MSFVCSWHLSQKELRISTLLGPLLGEPVGVKEREQERERPRDIESERERGHGEEIQGETRSKDEGGAVLHGSCWRLRWTCLKNTDA